MKYPRFDNKPLDIISRKRFDKFIIALETQITFDNRENEMELTEKDIELLAYNSAVMLLDC